MSIPVVTPLPGNEYLTPYLLVGYNGYKSAMAIIANPEDVFFITDRHHPPSASIWIVPQIGYEAA